MIPALLAGLAVAVGMRARSPSIRVPMWLIPCLPALLGVLLIGPAGAAAAGAVAFVGRRAWVRRSVTKAQEAERAGAVEAMSVLAAELRAGRGPSEAMAAAALVAVGPFAVGLGAAARSASVGADAAGTLRTSPSPALQALGACVQVCASSGSSLAVAVETVAESLRAEQVQREVVAAELAGPRTTAVMLAGLPLAGVLLAAGLGAHPLHVLLHTAVGAGCLMVGVGLDLLGLWWTERLVQQAIS